jgi:hypothetical protein
MQDTIRILALAALSMLLVACGGGGGGGGNSSGTSASSYPKLRLANATASSSLLLNAAGISDEDVVFTTGTVVPGGTSSYQQKKNQSYTVGVSSTYSDVAVDTQAGEGLVSLDAGTYRLRVTAAGSATDVRLDRSGVALSSKGVCALIVAGTTGGVLTDAMLQQQGGVLTELPSTKARVRAVVGLDGGSTASVSVDGTSLVASATIPVLGSYHVVDASATSVSMTLDGSQVDVAGLDLAPGSDYTLVYTGTPALVTQSAIVDVNRLPATGTLKMRLVNAMSALGEPVSMSVNFLPLVDSVQLGSVALSGAIDAVGNGRIDVTRVTTSTVLYSLTSLSLESQGVYTQVMFGSASSPIGALRKDR